MTWSTVWAALTLPRCDAERNTIVEVAAAIHAISRPSFVLIEAIHRAISDASDAQLLRHRL
jgi:uncharacterized protein (DUF1778 family)